MAKLSLWLPPFSPDYSGAAAVLFDLKTVTAMHDGSGCTGNYTGYDEPRWFGSQSGIYCSGLREIDAVLGNDEKLIEKMIYAAKDMKPDILGLIGSPVPMVIGSDLKGIAAELEERTGIVSIGIDTTGTDYYDKGAYLTSVELLKRFTKPEKHKKSRINILGALPMDFYKGEEIDILKKDMESHGFEIGLTFAMNYTLEDLKNAAKAEANVAISRFGFLLAKYMEETYGIPYLAGFPAGEVVKKQWYEVLRTVCDSKRSVLFKVEWKQEQIEKRKEKVFIIGEQMIANGIRNALRLEFGYENIVVGSIYGIEKMLSEEGDLDLNEEKKIREAINLPQFEMLIGDPLMQRLLENDEKTFLPFAQYGVSSKIGIEYQTFITGEEFNKWFLQKTHN